MAWWLLLVFAHALTYMVLLKRRHVSKAADTPSNHFSASYKAL